MIKSRDAMCTDLCRSDNRVYACDDCPLRTVMTSLGPGSTGAGGGGVENEDDRRSGRSKSKREGAESTSRPGSRQRLGRKQPRQHIQGEELSLQRQLDELLAESRAPGSTPAAAPALATTATTTTQFYDPYLERSQVTDASMWNNDEDSVDLVEEGEDQQRDPGEPETMEQDTVEPTLHGNDDY